MRFAAAHTGRSWEITGLCGQFKGVAVATADAIAFESASFSSLGRILGTITSVWGASLDPGLDWNRELLFHLGIGRPFDMRPNRVAHFDGDDFLDYHTNQKLGEARAVTTYYKSIHYWR